MASEDAENSLKSKLMGILEEELLALNLGEEKKCDKNGCLDLPIERKVDDAKKEIFSLVSGNKTVEKGLENLVQNEVKCKYEDFNPSTESVIKGNGKEPNYQHQETECIHKSEAFNTTSKKVPEKEIYSTYHGNDKVCIKDIEYFPEPSDNLSEEILRQVEFYFQDYNIFKNSYLLNYVRRSKNGYVSVKLVASLRKVKTLTRDYRVVAYSLKNSKFLELNREGNKVRRIKPIPRIEDTSFGKTVMVFNLPQHGDLTKDHLKELFSKFGSVVFVDVFENKYPDSDVYHERCLYFHRKIASKMYGIVEFERYSQVVKALKDDEGYLPKENEMKVVPLMPQIYQKEKKYLKFRDVYDAYPQERHARLNPRNESYFVQNETHTSRRDKLRNENVSVGSYPNNRGNFRRAYRGRRHFVPQTKNKFLDAPISDDYKATKRNKTNNSREQKNISVNTAQFYPNMHPRKPRYERFYESKTFV